MLSKSLFIEMFGQKFESESVKLGEVATFLIGLTYKPKYIAEQGTIVLRSGNIQKGELNIDEDIVRVRNIAITDTKIIKHHDILMCSRNGSASLVGKCCLIQYPKEDMTFGAFMTVIRSKFQYVLYEFFQSNYFKNQLTNVGTSSINQITTKMLNNFYVIHPSEQEEKFFSAFLKQKNIIKNIVYKKIKKLELLKKSRFIELFDFYFKNKINLYPIKKICVVIDYRGKTPEKSDSGIPLITAKNIKNNLFLEEPREFIPKENYEKIMTRGVPKVNDVLFTTEAPLGSVCRIPNIYDKFCVGQRIITLQPDSELLVPEYLEHALLSNIIQQEIWKNSSGSTVKGIRSQLFVEIKIPIPPLELQEEFKRILYQIDKSKLVLQKALENLVGKV